MKKLWILPFMLLTGACATLSQANLDWIPIGPEFPKNQPANVEIITDKSQITRPYGNLGLLRIRDLAPDRDTLKRGVEKPAVMWPPKEPTPCSWGSITAPKTARPIPGSR